MAKQQIITQTMNAQVYKARLVEQKEIKEKLTALEAENAEYESLILAAADVIGGAEDV